MQDVFQECYLELHSAKSPGKVHTSDARPTCSKMGKHQRAFFRSGLGLAFCTWHRQNVFRLVKNSVSSLDHLFSSSLFRPLESMNPLKLALSCFFSILKNEKYEGRVRHLPV